MDARALEGKVALVTGGSRGIGRAIAHRLGRDGATVAVAYARDETAAKEVVERIREDDGRAFALREELGRHGDAARLWAAFDAHAEEYAPGGGVDIIVNNAGIGRSSDLASLTESEFDEVFAVNVRAPFFIVQQGLPRLRDGGRIINISSGVSRIAMPEIMAYGATKGALDNFTLNLAKELGPRGITANSVAPGIIDTDVNAGWLRADPRAAAQAASLAALGRVGQPEDVAGIVAFLASDDARWVTGRVIDATGGSGL
ncbi:NAD(P)-dependent dehydrogenase (short-subunit alcohol dehydrogenase family) [Actinomadura coerulea]|uniref:NAD(P)-dependent dehydrogenase (Short-subunit alcohol dehydrogenase family) n=1 Tax=Actinomadura coerulea TaxID=46159 RepID=A0A7X0L190_9ACTN|nr:SDR family oxidoreductase [Actinomadura coerulea]MBB6398267.1 NAD(P)-dependent dehydrogenase (short-subunit alcohol dehydrogenase family) [Actinomadura coerulea]GGQ10904.1 3-oxoacyl-ACP reductase [Actinomadura coerulea]